MRIMALLAVAATAVTLAGQTRAQTVTGGEAGRQLFSSDGVAVAVSRELNDTQRLIVTTMASEAARRGQDFKYYGTIAFSPSEGLQSETLQGAFNFHAPEAADRAALSACAEARPAGSARCVVAGRILPRGWEDRPVQLSADATRAFEDVYLGAAPPRAFAISPKTGAWAIARGETARADAEARCNENAAAAGGPAACRTVIAE